MAVSKRPSKSIDLGKPNDRPTPHSVTGRNRARVATRMMTVAERVAFADDIRSRSRPTDEDSTDLIRRDRDER